MEFDAVLLPPRRARMIAQGWWLDRTINDELDACAAACPDKVALTACRMETGEVTRFTYGELARMADRILKSELRDVSITGDDKSAGYRTNGKIGDIGGFTIYASNVLPYSSTATAKSGWK